MRPSNSLIIHPVALPFPQFGLLSHVSSLRLSPGHSVLVLTLSSAVHASLFSPCLLVVDTSICAISPLGVSVRCVICGIFFFLPGYVVLWDSKTPHRPTSERLSWCLETSPPSQLPPWDGSPSLTLLSLFLYFIFFPTSFRREWTSFLGAWCSLPAFRSCFVEFAQCGNDLSMSCGKEIGLPILFFCRLRLWKIIKEMAIQDHLTCLLRNL